MSFKTAKDLAQVDSALMEKFLHDLPCYYDSENFCSSHDLKRTCVTNEVRQTIDPRFMQRVRNGINEQIRTNAGSLVADRLLIEDLHTAENNIQISSYLKLYLIQFMRQMLVNLPEVVLGQIQIVQQYGVNCTCLDGTYCSLNRDQHLDSLSSIDAEEQNA